MGSEEQPKTTRMFFALWPEDALRESLSQQFVLTGRWRGKPVVPSNYHITLEFLGNVTAEQRTGMERVADTIELESFDLYLDHLGFWRRPQVLWFGAEQVPKALKQLVGQLRAGCESCDLKPDSRPYYPHMTLMRKVKRGPDKQMIEPIKWSVNQFVLVESTTLPEGVQYRPVCKWDLQNKK